MALTDRRTHFESGENWRDYAQLIDESRIDRAIAGLRKLIPDGLSGKSFLDIGCGSGLHSLAALKLGARSIVAIDIDENSVATTRELLTRLAPPDWRTEIKSAFDLDPSDGTFDVIYSWASCTTPTTCGARSRRPHVWFARR